MAPKKGQAEKELTGEELQAQQQHNKLLKQAVAKGVSCARFVAAVIDPAIS